MKMLSTYIFSHSSRFRRALAAAAAFLIFAVPFSYLAAGHVSLQKQLSDLREKYPSFTEEEVAVVEAVKNTEPSVVSIVARREVFTPSEKFLNLGNGFQIVVPGELQSQGKQVVSQGSGFVIRGDGLIATNKHVIADKDATYQAVFSRGRAFDVELLATDPFNDLALIKIKNPPSAQFKPLSLGNSKKLKIGQTVIAIGNALGEFQNSVTKGVVSALDIVILATDAAGGQTERLVKIIQTDAAINPGNSGGPLLSTNGEVIGINTAVNQGAENIGFAIPVNDLKFVLKSYEKFGAVRRPFLGVRYAAVNEEVQRKLNLPYDHGMLLVRGDNGEPAVTAGSPAARADLREGDIILSVGNKLLDVENDLVSALRDYTVGKSVEMRVFRKSVGREETVTVTLAEMK